MSYRSLLSLLLLIAFSACEKESLNHVCKKAELNIRLKTHVNGVDFNLNDTLYEDYLGRKYRIELLKFYLSNMSLEKADGSRADIFDVRLVDYYSENEFDINVSIDTGAYTSLNFGLGLDSVLNASDPASFEPSHPLSIAQNTYWTWASKYKFFMLEGRVDTLGSQSPDVIFSYHSGFDTLYKEISIPTQDLFLTSEGDSIQLYFDLAKAVNGDAGTIDFVTQSFSHSVSDFEIVQLITENLQTAFTLK